VEHHIVTEYPFYIERIDTIIIRDTLPAIIDTAAILQKYFAYYTYSRSWNDSLLSVSLTDVITENKVMDSQFSYRILRPQEIINNTNISYSYSKYIYLGLQSNLFDLRYSSFSGFVAFPRLLVGGGYILYQKAPSLTIAWKVAKFK
jgi:hypothetical protein